MKRRPTRRDLLIVIGRLQAKIGRAMSANNDRNPHRQAATDGALREALALCTEARGHDPPIDRPTGPWAAEEEERTYV